MTPSPHDTPPGGPRAPAPARAYPFRNLGKNKKG